MRSLTRTSPSGTRRRDGGRLAGRHSAAPLLAATIPGNRRFVERHEALRQTRGAQLLQPRRAAEAAVGPAGTHELLGSAAVAGQTLTLSVRTTWAATIGTLVPGEAQPLHVVEDGGLVAGIGARHVGVFDAQHEDTAAMAREQVVEQCRAPEPMCKEPVGLGAKRTLALESSVMVLRSSVRGRPANPRESLPPRSGAAKLRPLAPRVCW